MTDIDTNNKEIKIDIKKSMMANEEILRSRLKEIRAVIDHPGEKGSAFEMICSNLIRPYLPGRYGVATGFIAWIKENTEDKEQNYKIEVSNQMDIIIYDATYGAPLINVGTCEIFPIECVYATIEVKTRLNHDGLVSFLLASGKVRANNYLYKTIFLPEGDEAFKVKEHLVKQQGVAVRSYLFAFESELSKESIENSKEWKDIEKNQNREYMNISSLFTGSSIQNSDNEGKIGNPDNEKIVEKSRCYVPIWGEKNELVEYDNNALSFFINRILKDLASHSKLENSESIAFSYYANIENNLPDFMPEFKIFEEINSEKKEVEPSVTIISDFKECLKKNNLKSEKYTITSQGHNYSACTTDREIGFGSLASGSNCTFSYQPIKFYNIDSSSDYIDNLKGFYIWSEYFKNK